MTLPLPSKLFLHSLKVTLQFFSDGNSSLQLSIDKAYAPTISFVNCWSESEAENFLALCSLFVDIGSLFGLTGLSLFEKSHT